MFVCQGANVTVDVTYKNVTSPDVTPILSMNLCNRISQTQNKSHNLC